MTPKKCKLPTVENIVELCLSKFRTLPKTGKPTDNEWTVLAGVVLHDEIKELLKVVSLGCGTKCVGQSKLCLNGFILNDSHAEVLARRAFMRYVCQELLETTKSGDEQRIFEWNVQTKQFQLKPNINFHFLSTQTPCGDACIVDESGSFCQNAEILKKRRKIESLVEETEFGNPLSTTSSEVGVFTGAKLIGYHNDSMQQIVGTLRTKPGRGDRTLSMSCSDKLAKWNVLGVQGALFDAVLAAPIYFKTFNFCCSSNKEALERAIYKRWLSRTVETSKFTAQQPEIRQCTQISFDYEQQALKQPSPNGLVWCNIDQNLRPYEISVNGKRQGVTSKKLNTPQAALSISKYFLLKAFINLLNSRPQLLDKYNLKSSNLPSMQYHEFKHLSTEYQKAWSQVKHKYFQQWTQKPQELQHFCIAEKAEEVPLSETNHITNTYKFDSKS